VKAVGNCANLEDEDRLIRAEREPASHYDYLILRKAASEAARPPFEPEFWRQRRADLEGAGFSRADDRGAMRLLERRIVHRNGSRRLPWKFGISGLTPRN
jgi:hypothetical protein